MAAFRIPNVLQNLFGEGSLSASFIPVYSRLLGAGNREEARRVAGAVAGLLGLVVGMLVLIGVLTAPWLVDLITPGFSGEKRELTIQLVRILFPGIGFLVLGAWCLGVLNSHGRFFLSYAAPVVWNLTIVATVVVVGPGATTGRVAVVAAGAAVAGSLLQFLVQLPSAFKALGGLRLSLGRHGPEVAEVRRTFGPALLTLGVAQIGAYVDTLIASLLPTGAVAGLFNAQVLYTLPVSLFGMSVAAAELPQMSLERGARGIVPDAFRQRIESGMERVAFFVVPSAAVFMGLGHLVAGLVFQSGRFSAEDARYVWVILAAASVGLLAGTFARLFPSAFYALGDTKTPFRVAALRMVLATTAGFTAARFGPALLGVEARWGVAGLTLASGLAGWVEFLILRRALQAHVGIPQLPTGRLLRLVTAAVLGVLCAWTVLFLIGTHAIIPQSLAGLGTFGVVYL
ncbi:MAG: murein biosynthesis integral membrane protein MurJ, partial [Gemmatimonadales bacterium]